MQNIYKDLMLLEDEQEEQDKDLILDMIDSLTHFYVEDEDGTSRRIPWYCMSRDVASDFGYSEKEMSDFAKDNGYIVFKISSIGSFDGGLAIADKDIDLDIVKENVRKSVVDDFEEEKDIPEVKISFEKNESFDTKHGDVENAPYVVVADDEKFAFDTDYEAKSFMKRNEFSFDKLELVDNTIKENKLDDLKVSSYKYLLDVYDRDDNFIERKLFRSRPEADKFVDAMSDLFDIKISNNEVVELKNNKDFFGTYWKVIRDLKKDESLNEDAEDVPWVLQQGEDGEPEYIGFAKSQNDMIAKMVKDHRSDFIYENTYIDKLDKDTYLYMKKDGDLSDAEIKELDRYFSVEESLEIKELEEELNNLGFEIALREDEHKDCQYCYRMITKEAHQTSDSFNDYVDRLEEAFENFRERTSYPCVFNIGLQDNGYICCNVEIKNESLKEENKVEEVTLYQIDKDNWGWKHNNVSHESGDRSREQAVSSARKVLGDNIKFRTEYLDGKVDEDIEKHDTLNQKLFDEEELKPAVAKAIMNIANEFVKELGEDGVSFTLKDVILLGSNMSYNYTKDSDLDIHLIADSSALECPKELQDKLYSAYRTIFNKNYDITIKGIPAEVYVEIDEPQAKSNGIYSLNSGWVKKPIQQDIPDLDKEAFDKEFKVWEDRYNDLVNNENATSEDVEQYINDIYAQRKEGIASDGEYSLGNLLFKECRNKGYLDNLKDLRKELKGKELSLEQLDNSTKEKYNNVEEKYMNKRVNRNLRENKEDDFDKRFDEKFGTGTDVFDVDEYMKRMKEMKEFE